MKGWLACIVMFLYAGISAQEIALSGLIQSEQSGMPVKNAQLILNGKEHKIDTNGFFQLKIDSRKTHFFRIIHPDFKQLSLKTVFLRDTHLVLFLTPNFISLDEVTVKAARDNNFGISRLNNVEGTTIYAGKKSEAVYVQDLNANLAANNSRQVFSKVAGINIFENEGSGSTVGIGGRGLNPNRISNFNTRQNGYDISADALGYPESYYTPPTEAIERIEILRGAAGLQFGTQFGGMINYRFTGASQKKISGNFRQTGGSFGFLNSFNQVSGTVRKISYQTFYQYKHYDGWRSRSQLNSHNAFGSVKYQVSDKLFLKTEYTFLHYLAQQAGGLTDKQFETDPALVTRHRNWFRVNWNLISLSADYRLSDQTQLNFMSFGLMASRDALGVLIRADRQDDTSAYRNLLSDSYKNYGAELRVLHRYLLFKNNSHFLAGMRYYKGTTFRQQGDADKSDKAVFKFLNPDYLENSSYLFPSSNYAFFCENIFQLTNKWSFTPGLRYEIIQTSSEGYYRLLNRNLAGDTLLDKKISDNRSNNRGFLLAGIGTQYKFNKAAELYANFSQNYRSINFNDMRVANPNFQVDPNLKDESGYTVDGGFRGAVKDLLYFDLGAFLLSYDNRIGTTLKADSLTYQVVRYRTNIGKSTNAGIEAFAELDWLKLVSKATKHRFSTFVNVSLIRATYQSEIQAYNNKVVEFVPDMILRTGFTYGYKKFSLTGQYSYTGLQYSDATNAETSPSAIYGIIPAYGVMDVSASYTYKKFGLSGGVNNVLNTSYFTRRAEGYPGPGIIPADPLNLYATLKYSF